MTQPTRQARGFTLIEVMVALAVLAIGILGIVMYTAVALRTSADNNVRATALQVASQAVEPLNAAARGGASAFHGALASTFPSTATPAYSRTVTTGSGETVTVNVPLDGGGQPLAYDDAATPVNWLAATGSSGATVTLVTQVGYTRIDGTSQNTVTTFTFVIN